MKNNKLKIINLESVDSTNNYAINLAKDGEEEITVVRAFTQTKGRGRLNRKWLSPKNKGLYVSFLLRPNNKIDDVYLFPLFFSFSVLKTIEDIVDAKIKFPNDVVVGDKKIAGVLVEACGNEKLDFVVVGIGLNINSTKKELLSSATSLYIETNNVYNIEELFKRLISNVLDIYDKCRSGNFNLIFKDLKNYQDFSLNNFSLISKKKHAVKFL